MNVHNPHNYGLEKVQKRLRLKLRKSCWSAKIRQTTVKIRPFQSDVVSNYEKLSSQILWKTLESFSHNSLVF